MQGFPDGSSLETWKKELMLQFSVKSVLLNILSDWKLYKFFINAAYLVLPLKDDTKKMYPLDFIDLEK